ncbi:MAG TPA: hypothetical protein ENJ87_08065 [Gammaproteobacteria bacterium]|nr:hypothetical protein [Gammaproteobacteria bacterium]
MFKTSLFFILLLNFYTLPILADSNQPDTDMTGWSEFSLSHGKLTRYFRVYRPRSLADNPAVVFVLHGGTQSMRKIFKKRAGGSQEWQTLADKEGFLLIAPNGINIKKGDPGGDRQNWNDCRIPIKDNGSASTADDVGFIDSLIDWSHQHYQTSLNRVYVSGASNGGMMTFRLLTELGSRFAAAAVFIANQPVQSDCSEAGYAVPLMIMNSTDDPLVLWQGGQIRKKGPHLLSSEGTLRYWLKVNRSNTTMQLETLPDLNKADHSRIIKRMFPATAAGSADLWFYEVTGAGHTMPSIKYDVPMLARWLVGNQNKDLEATHEAWNFMKKYSTK